MKGLKRWTNWWKDAKKVFGKEKKIFQERWRLRKTNSVVPANRNAADGLTAGNPDLWLSFTTRLNPATSLLLSPRTFFFLAKVKHSAGQEWLKSTSSAGVRGGVREMFFVRCVSPFFWLADEINLFPEKTGEVAENICRQTSKENSYYCLKFE